ncbi:MAG: hypothetical protein V5B36_13160 [Candidatus Accumulibacter sp. UW25]|jgi:hypothetical protein
MAPPRSARAVFIGGNKPAEHRHIKVSDREERRHGGRDPGPAPAVVVPGCLNLHLGRERFRFLDDGQTGEMSFDAKILRLYRSVADQRRSPTGRRKRRRGKDSRARRPGKLGFVLEGSAPGA